MPKLLNIFSNKKPDTPLSVIIDHREKNSLVVSELTSLNFKIIYKQLPVADYIINNVAIERKTVQDFKSSIINKRIITQLLEIKQYPHHILLIEGNQSILLNNTHLHENAVRGFLLSTALEFKIPIIFTKNEKETAKYIHILAKKNQNKEISLRPSKFTKNKHEQVQYILEGFPNIGPTIAKKLIKKFKTLSNIFSASEEDLTPILKSRAKSFKALLE